MPSMCHPVHQHTLLFPEEKADVGVASPEEEVAFGPINQTCIEESFVSMATSDCISNDWVCNDSEEQSTGFEFLSRGTDLKSCPQNESDCETQRSDPIMGVRRRERLERQPG